MEAFLLHSKCTFEAVQDPGDLGSAAAALQVRRDNQDCHLQIKQTCIGKQSWLRCENMYVQIWISYQSCMATLQLSTKLVVRFEIALILKVQAD